MATQYSSYSSVTHEEIVWFICERRKEGAEPFDLRAEVNDLVGFRLSVSEFAVLWRAALNQCNPASSAHY